MSRPPPQHTTSFFDRALGALVGGAAGAVFHLGWGLYWPPRVHWPQPWLSPSFKWFVLVGVVVGAIGGLDIARALWDRAMDDFLGDTASTLLFWVVLVGLVVALFFGIRYFA